MIIRTAAASDAAAIRAIWNPIIRDTDFTFTSDEKSEANVADLVQHRPTFLIAEDKKLLGFATFGQFRSGIGYRHSMEHTVILAPGARGKGTGRDLMQALESHARALDVHVLVAGISGGNRGAIAFHKAIGFSTIGVVKEAGWKFDRWYDLHLMQKTL